ncbi:sulfite exporter TauE/SafE family protein [Thiorhodococcus minor]|uniref:Sulfite exporter TauE/SafE family protein n=2 Tax=Thiorhodococcus minor TaxID=57489 RepID=A0A6M0JTM3_9GAMM|nr:sulfite exporter TauE/SafE family protein [Thiorhodococcus minor]NEV60886.1 sulfite exporter TauE/SafE family protein [Thiorhodococcus minor]
MRRFRARIFKPAEGVFLFHPRAMERLIAEHLETLGHSGSVPPLPYYLMPCPDFLRGLESENPEALAVIEGLNLPEQIILLPMPVDLRPDEASMTRLLRDYWARRFEGEIGRAWDMARRDNQDRETYGPEGLRARIGDIGFAEIREVLERDNVLPAGLDDATLCRAFVALVTRLRYFCPGARGFFFPAIRDWGQLDAWLIASGLGLPPPKPKGRLPQLLEHARPEQRCGHPTRYPLLPEALPYGCSDPDFRPPQARGASTGSSWDIEEEQRLADAAGDPALLAPRDRGAPEARCLAALRQGLQLQRTGLRIRVRDWLLGALAPLLEVLLGLRVLPRRGAAAPKPARGLRLELYLLLFRHAVRRAQRAELADHYAAAIRYLAVAERRFQAMGEPCAPEAHQVRAALAQRRLGAEQALSDLLAAKWKLSPEDGDALGTLVKRLGTSMLGSRGARTRRAILRDLDRVLHESRTTYYQLRPFAALMTLGRLHIRQILPFQASLKALRALDTALARVERLGWPIAELEQSAAPLRTLSSRISDHLEQQLKPHLSRALRDAGFAPSAHREEVAFNKLLHELLDVIRHRRHLKFTDTRDIVARNVLRLPDLSLRELLRGDRLARFDRCAARALPGVYKRGELYIKGLQQLSAPLFGTPPGRLLLRHLILPLGLSFLGLKTLDVVVALFSSGKPDFHFAGLLPVTGIALALNAIAYTRIGRIGVRGLLHGLWWGLRLLLFDGLRRLLRWRPVSRLLDTELVRGLDRNLLRPFFIGAVIMLPVLGLASLIEGEWIRPNVSMVALTLALGVLVRNTPAGKRFLDDMASASARFVRRLNQTLVLGLINELMRFFKELTRRFQQGLHRIEERLSHYLGESGLQLVLKSLLVPVWRLLESLIQFYVTVLVEPQINPIKHFPVVTIAHKLMLPFLPLITGFLVGVLEPVLPKWIALPFVTLTVLLLPGLGGFLVWELKENWKVYAANHGGLQPDLGLGRGLQPLTRVDLAKAPVEPAVVGSHGETLRSFLRRGFHSGTLPKAFDRLRGVLRAQIRSEVETPHRVRDAQRHLAEIEHMVLLLCDRELGYALRLRCQDPGCSLARIETGRPRLSTACFELTLTLETKGKPEPKTLRLWLRIWLLEPELHLRAELTGPSDALGERCRGFIREDLEVFSGRAGATQTAIEVGL